MQVSKELFEAIYASPLLKPKNPTRQEIDRLTTMFCRSRTWFSDMYCKYQLHPMIHDLLIAYANEHLREYLTDWREMVLEWAHVAKTDPTRIAYTQDNTKGERDIQTITSLGKYLKRHMPTCPDHLLRDFVTRYTVDPNACGITDDLDRMIHIVRTGPESCMSKFLIDERHPYRVYDPKFGWAMAYRKQGEAYWGRALVNTKDKHFVRSYKRNPSGGYSNSDEMLEAWLENQGYRGVGDWEGCAVARIPAGQYDSRFIMPYIDGNSQQIIDCGDHMEITDDGEYDATTTDGYAEESCSSNCDHCGDRTYDDDLHSVGYHGDTQVCHHCLDNHYTWVRGRSGEHYYLDHNSAVYCESDDTYYDEEYLDRYDVVMCEDSGNYYLLDEMWRCEGSGNFYNESVPSFEVEGESYHEDYLPDGWEVVDGELRELETA
jgi:hypothetical protein